MQRADEVAPAYDRAREAGDFDIAAVIAGEAAGLIDRVVPAATVVHDIVAQARALLRA